MCHWVKLGNKQRSEKQQLVLFSLLPARHSCRTQAILLHSSADGPITQRHKSRRLVVLFGQSPCVIQSSEAEHFKRAKSRQKARQFYIETKIINITCIETTEVVLKRNNKNIATEDFNVRIILHVVKIIITLS